MTATSFYPIIKYTAPNGDIDVYKSNSLRDVKAYRMLADLIANRTDFDKDHCAGCTYVHSIVSGTAGGKGTGSPTTWKLHMMVHHIATTESLLR